MACRDIAALELLRLGFLGTSLGCAYSVKFLSLPYVQDRAPIVD